MNQSNRFTRTVEPTNEPVNTQAAKDHLRVTATDEDARIDSVIKAAREWVERHTSRALLTQTWALYLDYFPENIIVPRAPLQSVTSISYTDTDGNPQTVSSAVYTVDTDSEPGLIYEAYSQNWPTARDIEKAVTVTFVAGFGDDPEDVPEEIRHAIKLHAEILFDMPDPAYKKELERTRNSLLRNYVIRSF